MAGDWSQERKKLNARRIDGEHCDFKILVKGETFPVHRIILDACSEYFRAMFASKTREAQQGYCKLEDVPAYVVSSCIEFMYTKRLEITNSKMAIEVLQLAHLWDLDMAVEKCEKFLCSNLDIANCILVRKRATLYDMKLLSDQCDQYILSNLKRLNQESEKKMRHLNLLEMEGILKRDQVRHGNIPVLWEFCMRWVAVQNDQSNLFCRIIRQFAVASFSVSEFKCHVWKNLHIKECANCREHSCKKILDALQLPKDLTEDNCIFLKHIAAQYGRLSLVKDFDDFIFEHTEVFESTDFTTHTTEKQLLHYATGLFRDKPCTRTQFSGIVAWLKQNPERHGVFPKLFKHDVATGRKIDRFTASLQKMKRYDADGVVDDPVRCILFALFHKKKWIVLSKDVFFIKHLTKQYLCHGVGAAADEFIMEYFGETSNMPEFLELPLSDMTKYVSELKKIYQAEPRVLWNAVLRWVNHNHERDLSSVFESMRLDRFPLSFVRQTICKCDLVLDSRACAARLFDVVFSEIVKMKDQQKSINERLAKLEEKSSK